MGDDELIPGGRGAALPGSDELLATFKRLQPHCLRLFETKDDPAALTEAICSVRDALESVRAAGLRQCLEYPLMPLTLLVESAAAARAKAGEALPFQVSVPAARGEGVAEAALFALLTLLERCPLVLAAQVEPLLQRLAFLIALPRFRCSEEMRMRAVQCVRALMGGAAPLAGGGEEAGARAALSRHLGSEEAAGMVGHLLSLLLQVAAAEAQAGAHGSRTLRTEAFAAVRAVVRAMPGPDALAFFLPGVASGLGKALLVTADGIHGGSGAAVGGSAAVEALGALSDLLVECMGDHANRDLLPPYERSEGVGAPAPGAAGGALAQLQALALSSGGGGALPGAPPAPTPRDPACARGAGPGDGKPGRLRVDRSPEWLASTAGQLRGLLERALPPLCAHPQPSVRAAVGRMAVEVLGSCGRALAPCADVLLGCALSLLHDDWVQVSAPCRAALLGLGEAGAGAGEGATGRGRVDVRWEAVVGLVGSLAAGLPRAVRSGDREGLAHARRLAAALEVAGPTYVRRHVVGSHGGGLLGKVSGALVQVLAFDPRPAPVMLLASTEAGAWLGPDPRSSQGPRGPAVAPRGAEVAPGGDSDGPGDASAPLPPGGTQDGSAAVAGQPPPAPAALTAETPYPPFARALPRMPPHLLHVASNDVFASVARSARLLGRAAALSGPPGEPAAALAALTDHLLGCFRRRLDDEGWIAAAPAAVVLVEAVYGASPAWDGEDPPLGPAWTLPAGAGAPPPAVLPYAVAVLEEFLSGPVWDPPPEFVGETARELGERAALERVVVEGVGALARAAGRDFARQPRMLQAALCPLLDKLGSPSAAASAAAEAALASVCLHCGYGSLRALVASNGDYVVDALCRQLRHLELHPSAPHLFRAVLRRTGAAGDLLPLMLEPVRGALAPLAVSSRRGHGQHTAALLQVLAEAAGGALAEAKEAREAIARVEGVLEDALDRAVGGGATVASEPDSDDSDDEGDEGDEGGAEVGGHEHRGKASPGAVRAYFERRLAAQLPSGGGGAGPEPPPGPSCETMAAVLSELEGHGAAGVGDPARRAALASAIAAAVVDTVAPLLEAKDLRARRLALDAAAMALAALECGEGGIKAAKEVAEALGLPEDPTASTAGLAQVGGASERGAGVGGAGKRDVPGSRLLPRAVDVWPGAVAGLRDPRPAAIQGASDLLVKLCMLGGGFFSRRVTTDAWPLLKRLLEAGSASPDPTGGGPGGGSRLAPLLETRPPAQEAAPGSKSQARRAALSFLARTARDPQASSALGATAAEAAECVALLLAPPHAGEVRAAAREALSALAAVSGDAVYLVLVDMCGGDLAAPRPPDPRLRPLQELLPAQRAGAKAAGRVAEGGGDCVSAAARAALAECFGEADLL